MSGADAAESPQTTGQYRRAKAASAGAAGLALVLFGLSGCASPVAAPTVSPSPPGCAELLAEVPTRISGQERREVEPDNGTTAAWGDPPVVLRCGVTAPAGLRPDSSLTEVNGVAWFAEQRSRGYVFTTVGRTPAVEVTVPDAYAPEGSVLAQLGTALSAPTPPGDQPAEARP